MIIISGCQEKSQDRDDPDQPDIRPIENLLMSSILSAEIHPKRGKRRDANVLPNRADEFPFNGQSAGFKN